MNNKKIKNYWRARVVAIFIFFFNLPLFTFATDLSDEVVEAIDNRIALNRYPGLIIGVLDQDGARYYAFGETVIGSGEKPTKGTIYEIGSITKTFTGLLLADLAVNEKLNLDDPVQQFLPDDITMPTAETGNVTLVQLSTHSSGLPRMPTNFRPANMEDPFADYTSDKLYAFLGKYQLKWQPESRSVYSNVAVGLLGHVLELHTQTPYEQLLQQRILQPLDMESTAITITPTMRENLAQAYRLYKGNFEATLNWQLDALQGAGAILSSAEDMLKYLSAQIGLTETTLGPAIDLSQQAHAKFRNSNIGLGWVIGGEGDQQIYAHDGGTGGYRTFAAFSKVQQKAVVVMTNSTIDVGDIGAKLLRPSVTLREFDSPQ